jgi:alginate O-acetyltransferase complex protein AlgI
VFFRAETLEGALAFLGAMFGAGASAATPYALGWYLTPDVVFAIAAGIVGSAPLVPALAVWRGPAWSRDAVATAALALIFAGSAMRIAAGTYNPFIYFRF